MHFNKWTDTRPRSGRHANGLTGKWTRKSFVADGRTRARLFTSANSDADAEVTPEQTAGLSLCPLLVHGLPLAGHLGVRDTCCSCVKTRDFPLSDSAVGLKSISDEQISSDTTSTEDAFFFRLGQEGHVWWDVNVPLNLSKTTTPALAGLLSLPRLEGV